MARLGAVPGAWKTQPCPTEWEALEYRRRFSRDEAARLRRGLLPEQMEDKWFIVADGDRLHFHRSWTGFCIFEADLTELPDGTAELHGLRASKDRSQYNANLPSQHFAWFESALMQLLHARR